jgi:elongation factor G
MDKFGADYYKSIASIEKYLNTIAIPIQIPIGTEKSFTGVIDLINMTKLCWNSEVSISDGGKTYSLSKLSENDEQYAQALKHRLRLIEKLAQADDKFAEILLDKYDLKYELVDDNILLETYLRKLSLNSKITPILCGSSFKNIAVQPLLDAIIKYLPSPEEREYPFQKYYGNNLCALCFKTIHDHKKMNKIKLNSSVSTESGDEILTFVRIYNGELSSKSRIFNSTKQIKEECTKIFIPYADQMKSVNSVKSGNIAVISGLKHVCFEFLKKHL